MQAGLELLVVSEGVLDWVAEVPLDCVAEVVLRLKLAAVVVTYEVVLGILLR